LFMWNDDEIAPAGGFASHSHVNMEIVVITHPSAAL